MDVGEQGGSDECGGAAVAAPSHPTGQVAVVEQNVGGTPAPPSSAPRRQPEIPVQGAVGGIAPAGVQVVGTAGVQKVAALHAAPEVPAALRTNPSPAAGGFGLPPLPPSFPQGGILEPPTRNVPDHLRSGTIDLFVRRGTRLLSYDIEGRCLWEIHARAGTWIPGYGNRQALDTCVRLTRPDQSCLGVTDTPQNTLNAAEPPGGPLPPRPLGHARGAQTRGCDSMTPGETSSAWHRDRDPPREDEEDSDL
jgi:hypothetical protein